MIGHDEITAAMRKDVAEEKDLSPEGVDAEAVLVWAFDYSRHERSFRPPDANVVLDAMIVALGPKLGWSPARDDAMLAFHLTNALNLGIRLGREHP